MQKETRFIDYFRFVMLISVSLLMSVGLLGVAKADDYPSKPINIMIPMAAGGGHDTITRAITPIMEKVLKTPIVIQYKTGGGGTIGWSWLAKQDPDGYNIGTYSYSLLLQQYSKAGGIKIDKFDFVSTLAFTEGILSVRSESPFKNFNELREYAKKNPGIVTVANSGTGAIWHLLAAGIEHQAGVKFTHVPMTGGGAAAMGMLGGHVTMSAGTISEVASFVKAGKVRILGVASETRSPMLPDVPTFKEQGVDFQWGTPVGFIAPKGIPESRLQILNSAIEKGLQSPQYQELMQNLGNKKEFYNYKELPQIIKKEDTKCHALLKMVGLAD